ncbi:MAG TPA: uL15m family ribosomal protein [Candidatus Nanoarchaeia archaeon]|nr:uL15m family ribosomal protein [Candidatus Nanoarchaeia archaeon]
MRFKKKKTSKKRGSKFHGYGRGAAHHKGAGNRGGRGRAGTGKRADAKKPSFWHIPTGKHGFASKNRMKIKAINLETVHKNLPAWVAQGFATKSLSGFSIELASCGYNKLLGKGRVSEKLIIITDFASKNAVDKVKKAGGEVKVLKSIVKKEKKPVEKKKAVEEVAEEKPAKDKKAEDKTAEES